MIKIVLIIATTIILLTYLRSFRSVLSDRLFALIFSVLVIAAVLFPDITTVAAQFVGVGRGADLVFYLSIVGGGFFLVLLYGKLLRQEQVITKLIRAVAIANAKKI